MIYLRNIECILYFQMKELKNWMCPKGELEFEAEKWQRRLGQRCQVCNISLTHQKCISLCRCYYFCHQNCFASTFQPHITDEQVVIRCMQCRQILHLNLQTNYKYSPSRSLIKLCKILVTTTLLILNILGIIFTLNTSMTTELSFIVLYMQGILLIFLLYLLVTYTRDFFYLKTVKINGITSTKLEIQTSAFKDLDVHTNEELTKDDLIFQTGKDRV